MRFIIYLSVAMLGILSSGNSAWHMEKLDGSVRGIHLSLAVSSTGFTHFCSLKDDTILEYVYEDESGFHFEIVDDHTSNADMVLDSDGYPHIAYCKSGMRYAYKDSAGWHYESIGPSGNLPDCSLALDPSGNPRVSYYNNDGHDLIYAWRDGLDWHTETVESDGDVGNHASIGIDSAGNPHLSYLYFNTLDLRYAHKTMSGWIIETVDAAGDFEDYTDLVLNAQDEPHISYYESAGGDLKYAYKNGPVWQIETVDSEPDAGHYASIALDSAGYPHIGYQVKSENDIEYAWKDVDGWHFETVDSLDHTGYYSEIFIESSGMVHLAYRSYTHRDLLHAKKEESSWVAETIGIPGAVWVTSLDLDSIGNPQVCYRNSAFPDLIMAVYNGSSWDFESLAGTPGSAPVLDLDTEDYPHIFYFESSGGRLRYLYRDSVGWHNEAALQGPITGSLLDFELDGSNQPHISFYDTSAESLKYCWHNGVEWQLETVDDEDDSGDYSSLAVSLDGIPHISYMTHSGSPWNDTRLKYARKDPEGWYILTLETEGAPGYYTAIDVDTAGYPHILHERDNEGNEPIMHLWQDESGWQTEYIDYVWDTFSDRCDFTLDSNDNPHACYWDDEDFRYASRGTNGWTSEIIGTAGSNPWIKVGSSGIPHITLGNSYLIYFRKDPDPTPTPTPECLNHGDVDFSGTHTAEDAQLAFQIVMSTYTPSHGEVCAADCDASGTVTAGDAQSIFSAVLGLDSCVDPV